MSFKQFAVALEHDWIYYIGHPKYISAKQRNYQLGLHSAPVKVATTLKMWTTPSGSATISS